MVSFLVGTYLALFNLKLLASDVRLTSFHGIQWSFVEVRLTKHAENCSEPKLATHVWLFLSPLLMGQVSHFLLCHSSERIILRLVYLDSVRALVAGLCES